MNKLKIKISTVNPHTLSIETQDKVKQITFKTKCNKSNCVCNRNNICYINFYTYDYYIKYLKNIIDDINNDKSNKLALLNINHENLIVRFVVKYKLNMCFQP